jgi:glycosyltransferase involved in cell wall biosynthesis
MNHPLVSIYIPTRNRLSLLKRAVYSVIGQTFRDIELIVVTDGSEDESEQFVGSIRSDFPVRLISNAESLGACIARNQAIEASTGRFVTGLDDDDWFRPDRIGLLVELWKSCTAREERFSALCDVTVAIRNEEVLTWNWDTRIDLHQIRKDNRVGTQVFTLRQRFLDCGLFDAAMPAWQDWDLWVRMIDRFGPAINLQQGTYFSDQAHPEPRITTRSSQEIRRAMELFARKHELTGKEDKISLLLAYARYPQAELSLEDFKALISAGYFRSAIRFFRKGRLRWGLE